jgi:uncharacterized RDD family membrane protein YckC
VSAPLADGDSPARVALGTAVLVVKTGNKVARVALAPARFFSRSPFFAPTMRSGQRRALVEGGELVARGERAVADLPERLAGSEAVRGAIENAVAHVDVERVVVETLESRYAQELAERVLSSPELERVIERVVASPAVRAGLTQQTTSFAEDVAARLRARARAVDERVSAGGSTGYGGLPSRGLAFVADLGLTFAIGLLVAAAVGLAASLVGDLRPAWLVGALAGSAWTLLNAAYFGFFWTVAGQTPGMRLLGLRVRRKDGVEIGSGRALVRFVALLVSIAPLFAGFLPALVDRRRRAFHDYVAGTVVTAESAEDVSRPR